MSQKRGFLIQEVNKELWYLDEECRANPVDVITEWEKVRATMVDIMDWRISDAGQINRKPLPWDFLLVEPWLECTDLSKIAILHPERVWYTNLQVLELISQKKAQPLN